jgi:hypothetical protein
MRGQATFHPICRRVVLGNAERGRRRRGNEDTLPLLGDELAPGFNDIGRQYTEWALAILQHEAVEIHEMPDAVGNLICCARDACTPKAVSDQDNIIELFRLNVIDDIRCECIERDVFRQQVLALPEPSLRRGADTVAHAT